MTVPRIPNGDQPWWRRRRGAIDTVIALLVVPAVIAIALFAGGAFSGKGDADVAVGSTVSAPEVQGPIVPTVNRLASAPSTAGPSQTTGAATTAPPAPPTAPTTTTAPPVTTAPTTSAPTVTLPPSASTSPTKPPSASPPPSAGPSTVPAPTLGTDYVAERGVSGQDVQTWQKQMVERGWSLETDGIFGPQTERVLKSFQAQKGLTVDGLLGQNSWTAAWDAPIT